MTPKKTIKEDQSNVDEPSQEELDQDRADNPDTSEDRSQTDNAG